MIDYKEIQEYIEMTNHVTLSPTQIEMLKAIIRGDNIYSARGFGRTMLYNGYADYLKLIVGKDTNRNLKRTEYDSIFTIDDFMKDEAFKNNKLQDFYKMSYQANPIRFNRDYRCLFQDKN